MMGELVVIGTISDVVERSGKKDGRDWRFVTAYVVGRREAFPVRIPDELEAVAVIGADVALSVRPNLYRGELGFDAIQEWSGELPATSSASRAA